MEIAQPLAVHNALIVKLMQTTALFAKANSLLHQHVLVHQELSQAIRIALIAILSVLLVQMLLLALHVIQLSIEN